MFLKISDTTWVDDSEIMGATLMHTPEDEHVVSFAVKDGGVMLVRMPSDVDPKDHDAGQAWLDKLMRAINAGAEPSDFKQAEVDTVSEHGWRQGYDQRDRELKEVADRLMKEQSRTEKDQEQLAAERAEFELRKSAPEKLRIDGREAYRLVDEITHRQPMSNYTLAGKLLQRVGFEVTDSEVVL